MKNYLVLLVISVLCLGIIIGSVIHKIREEPATKENPFTKIGVLATKNGVVAEVFKIENSPCHVLVTTMPNEYGRGSYQLECK